MNRRPTHADVLRGTEKKDLRHTAAERGKRTDNKINLRNQNQNPRIAYAERRVKPLARLLRCATALRVTAAHGGGSQRFPLWSCWGGVRE